MVTVRVRYATTCTFLRQYSTFSSLYPLRTVSCASGAATVVVPAIANSYKAPVRLTYAVRVRGAAGASVQQRVTVTQAAAPSAPPPTITPPPTTITPPPTPSPPPTAWAQSPNWSGYVVPSSTDLITTVSGAWTVSTLDCSTTPDGEAWTWVGIGGYQWQTGGTSGTLLQTGIRANCTGGVPNYSGWFEEFPSSPNTAKGFIGFPVSPGDSIVASVFQGSTGAWETKVDDLTTGLSGVMVTGSGWGVSVDGGNGSFLEQGSTVNLSYSGGYTAEWIVEDPAQSDGTVLPFADYGTVHFTDLRTSLSSWYLAANEGVAIAQDGVVLSTPTAPANDGFSVSYTG